MAELELPIDGKIGVRKCSCDFITPELIEELVFGLGVAEEEGKITPQKEGYLTAFLEQIASGCGVVKEYPDALPGSEHYRKYKQLKLFRYVGKESNQDKAFIWAENMRTHGESPYIVEQPDGDFAVFVESL